MLPYLPVSREMVSGDMSKKVYKRHLVGVCLVMLLFGINTIAHAQDNDFNPSPDLFVSTIVISAR